MRILHACRRRAEPERSVALVTHNVRDFRDAAASFGVRVVRPAELLPEVTR